METFLKLILRVTSLTHGKAGYWMIYLDKDQLEQVEYLFNQSANGIHVLFDNATIRRVLSIPTEQMDFFTFENVERIQKVLSDFISKRGLEGKREYLEALEPETHDLLVRTYFNIVENSIFESGEPKH